MRHRSNIAVGSRPGRTSTRWAPRCIRRLSGRDPATEPPFSFPPLRKLCPDLNPALAAVVDQALAYDVVNRMRDATEFKRRLIEIQTGESSKPAAASGNRSAARPQLPLPLGIPSGAAEDDIRPAPNAASPAARSTPAGSSASHGSSGPAQSPIPAAAIPPAAYAPTVLSVPTEIRCPSCARMIPADSRFCSYCAADLRETIPSFEMGSSADAKTRILTHGQQRKSTHHSHRDRTRPQAGSGRRRSRFRHPLIIIAAIFALSFIIKMIIINTAVPASPPDDTGSIAPPNDFSPDGNLRDARLSALRQALDDAGYENVQFRMNGDILELWGTVPSEFDRVAVQTIVFRTAGIASMQDNLRVHDIDAGP